MDTQLLAEQFIAHCLAPRSADEGTHEVASALDDGRAVIIAACPPTGSAALAVQLDKHGVEMDSEIEHNMLQAVWNDRLANGFVVARENDGKDYVALVAHRSTAAAPALAASLARLLAAAADPGEDPASGEVPPALNQTWISV